MSESKVDFSIVIPAYNEAGAIGSVLERLGRELDTLEKKYEIVVVSDGSTDATADEVRAVGEPCVWSNTPIIWAMEPR